MRLRGWFLVLSLALAVVLSGISCCDDDCWDDDDYCHYDRNGYWHCHDDDDYYYHSHAQTVGEVIVLITDQPTGDVSAFYVTISEVTLFETDAGPVSVYQSEAGRRLDLLSLRGLRGARLHELLAVREIPSGVYASVRLTLRDPAMVLSSGEVLEGTEIDLAGQGQIDIDLAEPVLLGPDETVRVTLDIDVHASVGPAARPEPRNVRPIVLVDVRYGDVEEEVPTRTDVEGELLMQDSEYGLFRLELPEDRGELQVRVLEDSEVLDRALEPAPRSVLTPGSQVIGRGLLKSTGDLDLEVIAVDPGPDGTLPPRDHERPAALLPAPIEGTVSAIDPEERTLSVEVDGTQRTIVASPETTILVVKVAEDGLTESSIPLRQVGFGASVVVHEDDGSRARLVIVTADD